MKETRFDLYCEKCEHKNLNEDDTPCDGCLTVSAQDETHKPLYFKERIK